MSATATFTKFSYGKEKMILLICPRCHVGPIILKAKLYAEIQERGVASALICRECEAWLR